MVIVDMEKRVQKNISSVNPFRCRMWAMHDRLECGINEQTCKAEIESIGKHGQLVPVLGRRLQSDPKHDFELIYGARRLFVCQHLNLPILTEVREITDREAVIAMDIENRHRKDISAYERGHSYSRWLHDKVFSTQDDIAHSLSISASQVSRMLKIARLPSIVVSAFGSAAVICESWGLELHEALNDPAKRQLIIDRARSLDRQIPRPAALEVHRQLLSSCVRGRKVRATATDEVVTAQDGKPLFRIRHQAKSVVLVLSIDRVSAQSLKVIKLAVAEILDGPKVKHRNGNDSVQSDNAHRAAIAESGMQLSL